MANRAFVLYVLPKAGQKHFRVGISVGKKVDNRAVIRNRIKRYIRASLTEFKPNIRPDLDFLVIARPSTKNFDMNRVKKNLEHVMKLSQILTTTTETEEKVE